MAKDIKYKAQEIYTAKMEQLGFKRRTVRVHDDDWTNIRELAAKLREQRVNGGGND